MFLRFLEDLRFDSQFKRTTALRRKEKEEGWRCSDQQFVAAVMPRSCSFSLSFLFLVSLSMDDSEQSSRVKWGVEGDGAISRLRWVDRRGRRKRIMQPVALFLNTLQTTQMSQEERRGQKRFACFLFSFH